MTNRRLALSSVCFVAALGGHATLAQVTPERIAAAADREPQNWLTYSGGYDGHRYSTLAEVNRLNVQHLAVQWMFQTGMEGPFQATPLVIDGVMYLSTINNRVIALDAHTGRQVWRYDRTLPEKIPLCCGKVNRGLAALGDRVYLATLDAHVVALDARTGAVVWDVQAGDYKKAETFTLAPLAVKDKIIVGVAGGDFGTRGFIDAYRADTGERVWRFHTVPGPGEPGNDTWAGDSWKTGGGPAWLTGTYDPELSRLYWGIGNPGPTLHGEKRPGDNLYTNSVVALDLETGRLQWHFQFTPHDVHDWDATQVPVLVNRTLAGVPRKLLLTANRNGFFYVLDRTTGAFLFAKPFVKVTWAEGIDVKGRPIVLPGTAPTPEGNYVCPGAWGGTNWMSPSFSPQTGLFYVAAREQCDLFTSAEQPYREGGGFFGSTANPPPKQREKDWGGVRAIDPDTGAIKWDFKHYSAPFAGVLSTAGGLVFAGDMEGYLTALDARTGAHLWHFQTGAPIYSAAITYGLDGRQYVAIPSGGALTVFSLPDDRRPSTRRKPAA